MPNSAHDSPTFVSDWPIATIFKLNGLDPEAYLRTLITCIADHCAKQIDELVPWNVQL